MYVYIYFLIEYLFSVDILNIFYYLCRDFHSGKLEFSVIFSSNLGEFLSIYNFDANSEDYFKLFLNIFLNTFFFLSFLKPKNLVTVLLSSQQAPKTG